MIGGSSSGSGWSFFRSSSSNSREPSTTSPVQPPAPSTSTSAAHPLDGDTPQSGNEELRSSTARLDDLEAVATTPDSEHFSYTTSRPLFDLQGALSSSTNEPPASSTNIQAPLPPLDPSAGSSSASGISFSAYIPVSPEVVVAASATPPHHLHSLTERKLEKAVLGRAVGLRQLVLLSNAFATRPPPPQPASHSLHYPYASTSQRTTFDEDEVLIFEEDEAERKRREEDWLDSVLDEMLTDAEDDEVEQEEEDQSRQMRIPTQSEREFREPYVHLSIKHGWQSYASSSSSSSSSPPSTLAAQHAALMDEEAEDSTQHLETSSFLSSTSPLFPISEEAPWPSDSGFMEPCAIPLPDSTNASPNSSAHSEMSDDDDEQEVDHIEVVYEEEQGTGLAVGQDFCEACDAASEEQWREQEQALHDQQSSTDAEYPQIGIPISLYTGATHLASAHSFTSLSLPELAYSATSLNTLSTSPSHSLNVFTPGTSPSDHCSPSTSCPTPSRAEREKQAWRDAQSHSDGIDYARIEIEPQDIMLPMDDLDLYDDNHAEEQSTTSSRDEEEKSSSSGSVTSAEDKGRRKLTTMRWTPSLELVRYRSGKKAGSREVTADDALRIPLYLPLSNAGPTGLFSSRLARPTQDSVSMPPLPPSLLSVMMGKTPAVLVELQSTGADERTSTFKKTYIGNATLPERAGDKLRLPLFLPSEIVKSLYDSVDFGLAPCVSSITSSPSQSPLVLPFEFPTVRSPGSSSNGGSTASRLRSKSLTLLDPLVHTTTNASPGGLLFSSLGLVGLGDSDNDNDGRNNFGGGIWDQNYASQRRRSLSSTPLDTFVQASEEILNNDAPGFPSVRSSRSMLHNRARNGSSRSPSRLRLFLDQGDSFAEDFEFGSI